MDLSTVSGLPPGRAGRLALARVHRQSAAAFGAGACMGKVLFQAIEFGRDTSWHVGVYYRLWFDPVGNLQLWNIRNNGVVWESGTRGDRLAMQADGNLTIYDSRGECIWSSGTTGHSNAYLAAQDDGNLVIYTADQRKAVWNSGTAGK